MKISKQIMNPMRKELLANLLNRGETNECGLTNTAHYKRSAVRLAIQRFAELGLINFTGGGFFEISSKGKEYLISE